MRELARQGYGVLVLLLTTFDSAIEAYLPVPATLLAGLQHSDMLPALARLAPLEADVLAHARFLGGVDPNVSAPADEADVFALLAHSDAGSASHVALSALMESVPRHTSFPRDEHLALLSPAHAEATHAYASRLFELGTAASSGASTPSSESAFRTAYTAPLGPGTLVAHAYVRYMGDLSGGQHIAKRARALWPLGLEENTGFESYVFAKPAAWTGTQRAWEGDLKRRFRDAMDGAFAQLEDEKEGVACEWPLHPSPRPSLTQALTTAVLVDEASLAFDLNRGLFDALVPSSEEDDARELAALLAASAPALAKTASALSSPRARSLLPSLPTLAVGLLAVATGLSSSALSA
jgi:hypothetical protein